ncbi:MAG TPA: hypothetical protein VF572_01340 [Candidatus Saccharimonadales bacterium]|jgi:hypothetical protein
MKYAGKFLKHAIIARPDEDGAVFEGLSDSCGPAQMCEDRSITGRGLLIFALADEDNFSNLTPDEQFDVHAVVDVESDECGLYRLKDGYGGALLSELPDDSSSVVSYGIPITDVVWERSEGTER